MSDVVACTLLCSGALRLPARTSVWRRTRDPDGQVEGRPVGRSPWNAGKDRELVCACNQGPTTISAMSAIQIAGCSCAGKSAVAAAFARRGLAALDADDDALLARFVDQVGAVVTDV